MNSQQMTTSNQYIKYQVVVTENSVDVVNNTSNVTVSVQAWRTNAGYTTYGSGTCYANINGTDYTASITSSQQITQNSYTVLGTWTMNVAHDNSGYKNLNVSAKITHSTFSSSYQTATFQLSYIARVSTPTLSKTVFNIGETITLYPNLNDSSFKYHIRLDFGDTQTWITDIITANSVAINTSLYEQLYTQIPNAQTGQGQFTLKTYTADSVLVGESCVLFTCNVTNSEPSILSFTAVDTNATTKALTGNANIIVYNKSNVKVSLSTYAMNGSTITSQKVNTSNKNYSTFPFYVVPTSNSFVATVTDSRKFVSKSTKNLQYVPYFVPIFKKISIERLSTTSETVKFTFNASWFNSSFGAVANTLVIKCRFKKVEATTWGSWVTITPTISENTATYTNNAFKNNIDFEEDYTFEVSLADKLNTETYVIDVPSGQPIMDIGKHDIEVNGDFIVTGDLTVGQKALIDLVYPVGSVYISIKNTNPSTLFGGTWATFGTGRTLVGVNANDTDFATSQKQGGSKTHTLTVAEMPTHQHNINLNIDHVDGVPVTAEYMTTGLSYGDKMRRYHDITDMEGLSQPHSIVQPYICVYMFKRTQ